MVACIRCGTKDILPEDVVGAGQDFYPVKQGNTWVYAVDTISYSSFWDGTAVLTNSFPGKYYLKEIIADSIGLQEGNPLFRVLVYRAPDSTGPWEIDSVWSIQRGVDKILKTENNTPVVKLKFPVTRNSRWDGNQYNLLQDSSGTNWFSVKNFFEDYFYNGSKWPSFKVVQKSDSNCLEKSDIHEIYLKQIGPAYIRKSQVYYSQEGSDPCGNIPRIESGKVRTYSLIRFEKGL